MDSYFRSHSIGSRAVHCIPSQFFFVYQCTYTKLATLSANNALEVVYSNRASLGQLKCFPVPLSLLTSCDSAYRLYRIRGAASVTLDGTHQLLGILCTILAYQPEEIYAHTQRHATRESINSHWRFVGFMISAFDSFSLFSFPSLFFSVCVSSISSLLLLHFLVRPKKTIVFGRTSVLRMMFFFFTREISEMRGPTGMKFCTVVSTRKTIFQPLGVAAPPKFLHALENDQVLLTHPHRGRGPPYNFFEKGVKNRLKM